MNANNGDLSDNKPQPNLNAAQEEALANFRQRREDNHNEQLAAMEARTPYEKALHEMAKEKDMESRANPTYRCNFRYEQHKTSRGSHKVIGAIALGGVLAAASVVPGAISNASYGNERAEHFLEEQGYTNPKLIDESIFLVNFQGCDKTDTVKYSYEATANNGKRVGVMVCKGLFKGATIRD